MAQDDTLRILQEIQALVSDKLRVVSYKWLSRNYLVSSNAAKRLLEEFVEKYGSGIQVVYMLSGWLKSNTPNYHIRLVSGSTLAEVKQDFDENCSIQIYSVQACIPKDPAALWNVEFIQAEELFRQPSSVENCLRDNRFCGISNSFIKRNIDGTAVTVAAPRPKGTEGMGPLKSSPVHENITAQPQDSKAHKVNSNIGQPQTVDKEVKVEGNNSGFHHQPGRPTADKAKVVSSNRNSAQNEKNSSSAGSTLANLWDRSSKSKTSSAPTEVNKIEPSSNVSTAEEQICAREAAESISSDDEDVNFKRASSNGEGGRKRKVVFDFSDDDEYGDAVSLASPENPKVHQHGDLKQSMKHLSHEESYPDPDKQMDDKSKVKGDRAAETKSNQTLKADGPIDIKDNNTRISSSVDDSCKKDETNNAAANSPKRRKVLKTRIDERGREVTEVIWEGEETGVNKDDMSGTKKAEQNTVNDTVNRAPAAGKKTPAAGNNAPSNPVGKAWSKKGGNPKDPKQGNIMKFFKKV